ncbi:MAG TPA: ABC transporter ATP-binding protein [Candidatus Faecivivens stercoripullorum]|uniref:ABC transporter ATP-binding protein n=1 Tax=Candidatus Faecivivens stercoripullorum TaxID=2840805 RepID=A0A9D1H782_9FIRM|nr:ABC transporter ATP-binding protein [Candidatus Faecivivens stercoripullorum]
MFSGKNASLQKGVPDKPRMKTTQILSRLWKYLYKFKFLLFAALVMTVTSNLLALAGPSLAGNAVNAIVGIGQVDFQTVFRCCGLMIICYALASLFEWLLSVMLIRLSQKIVFQMRKDVFDHLTTLPVSFFDRHQTGDIISHISYDIDTVNTSLSSDLVQICSSVITVVGSLIMMICINPPLVLVFVVTVPISIMFTRYMSKKVRPLFSRRSAKMGELNGYTEESISGHKTIKSYHQEETMNNRFSTRNTESCDAYYQADYASAGMGPSVNFINNLSLALISVFGAMLYLFGGRFALTLGDLSSFVLYSRKFSGPINEIANVISELQSALAAAERVFLLLEEKPEAADAPDAQALTVTNGEVEMEHIRFGYLPGQEIIHDLTLKADGGSLTAIVGPTGAGKTTLTNLLMRFYDPDSGTICIDRQNIQTVTRSSLRLAYAMVLQETWLFTGTVRENIAYGRPDASQEEIEAAAKAAYIHDFIMALPQGYDTLLTEDGINISQGQKQLLTIARAMLLDAQMLILDEATSNVDTRTEIRIQAAMRQLMKGKTCFVIAHRLSTIQNADNILVVRDGDIVEQGTHSQLIEKDGFYARLFYSQFS